MNTTLNIKPEQRAMFDFPIAKVPLFTEGGVPVSHRAIMRTDTNKPISVVTEQYHVFEHKDVLRLIEPFMLQFGTPEVQTYTEKEGARALFVFKFKGNTIHIGNPELGDVVALKITAINSYDLSTSLQLKIGGERLVCKNGMAVANGELNLHYRHTKQISEIDLPDPEILLNLFKNEGKAWDVYAQKEITTEIAEDMVEQAFRLNIISKKAYNESLTEFAKVNTFWDLYNAFTFAITHYSSRVMESAKYGRLARLNTLFRHFTAPKVQRDVTPIPAE